MGIINLKLSLLCNHPTSNLPELIHMLLEIALWHAHMLDLPPFRLRTRVVHCVLLSLVDLVLNHVSQSTPIRSSRKDR